MTGSLGSSGDPRFKMFIVICKTIREAVAGNEVLESQAPSTVQYKQCRLCDGVCVPSPGQALADVDPEELGS